jgi:hypothetical protein
MAGVARESRDKTETTTRSRKAFAVINMLDELIDLLE